MDTLIDLIQSFENNNNPALIYHNGYRRFVLPYNDLYILTLKCAAYLKKKGIEPGDKIMLWGPNGPDWVIAYFGIIALGAVVVPLDFKSERAAALKIAALAGIKLLVKTKFKPSLNYETIYLEELNGLIKDEAPAKNSAEAGKNDLAQLVYTSGTTGDPKGVMISHYNLLSNVKAVARRIDVGEKDCFLSVLPLSHLFEQTAGMLTPLSASACIVYLAVIKPSAIFKALKNEPVSVFLCVPRLLQGFKRGVKDKFDSGIKKGIWSGLSFFSKFAGERNKKRLWFLIHAKFNKNFRFFVSGGSYLDPSTEKFWESLGFKIVQGYGLTECSPILTVNSENKRRLSSIGQPLDNVALKINPDGELLARGPNVFKSYYNNEEKTKEAFQSDWFLTGDIAVKDADGFYFIKSRKKDLIVTADGVNVYPEEVENVINAVKGIKEAAVLGLDWGNGEEVSVAIIPDKNLLDIEAAVKEANGKLDQAQRIRHAFIWEEAEFPKTTTLKVKKNLLAAKLQKERDKSEVVKAVSGVIKIIAQISGLPVSEITPEKLIYRDLKIDSIGRVELVSGLEQEFTLDIAEDAINEKTSVKELEEMVEKRQSQGKKYAFHPLNFSRAMIGLKDWHWQYLGRPFLKYWCDVKAEGLENIKDIKEPVIFMPNHLTFADGPAMLLALPPSIRKKTAFAAGRAFFHPPGNILKRSLLKVFYFYVVYLWGAYPFSRRYNIKKSLEYSGRLLDKGINIILFPEGERGFGKSLKTLQRGAAAILKNLQCQVVPTAIIGADTVLHRDWRWPRRGQITVRFGQPLRFSGQSDAEILARLKNEIESLQGNA